MALHDLLANNRAWAAAKVAADPEFFRRQSQGQHPRLLWIGCSDSRVPPGEILGCGPGNLFVHRNVANVVAYNDVNIAAVLQFGLDHLQIEDVVVCGHYGCGGVKAACEAKVIGGYIGDWLMIVTWAKRWVDDHIASGDIPPLAGDDYLRRIVDENVRLQIRHLARLSVVRTHWERTPGVPRLHGWVYDLDTGLMNVVLEGKSGTGLLGSGKIAVPGH